MGDLKKDQLIEMQATGHVQMEFEQLELQQFWCSQLSRVGEQSIAITHTLCYHLLTCEMGFSSLFAHKN